MSLPSSYSKSTLRKKKTESVFYKLKVYNLRVNILDIEMVWMFVPPSPQVHAEIRMPDGRVLGSEAFGRSLSHELEPSWMGLLPYKKTSRESPSPFHHVKTQQEVAAMNQEEGPHQKATMLAPSEL